MPRIFNIMQYEKHPISEEILLTEEKIQEALSHKMIKQWAYIAHTEDTYTIEDQEKDIDYIKKIYQSTDKNEEHGYLTQIEGALEDIGQLTEEEYISKYQRIRAGEKKGKHWHIVCRSESDITIKQIAKWFGIPENFVDVPKGQGAFLDCVAYLMHEGQKAEEQGKVHYDDSLVRANFDFRRALDEKDEKRKKYGRDLSEKDEIRYRVLYEGLTLSELCNTVEGQLAYQNDYATLDRLRLKYIQKNAPLPAVRINYYVCGSGGIGKNLMCRALARGIAQSLGIDTTNDQDIYFEVGADGATFEGYDGQPVIIWNDFRAGELLKVLGGRGNVFKVFEMFPTGKGRQNVKYDSITLINCVNIVNSVQSFRQFLDGLAGDYKRGDGTIVELAEDKSQSYRRFPFIIPIHESDFDLMMNKGVFEGTREYMQYISYHNIRGSMARIAQVLSGDPDKRRQIEDKTVAPVIDMHNQLLDKVEARRAVTKETLDEFDNYGTRPDLLIPNQLMDKELNNNNNDNFTTLIFDIRNQKKVKIENLILDKDTEIYTGAYRHKLDPTNQIVQNLYERYIKNKNVDYLQSGEQVKAFEDCVLRYFGYH